MKTFAGYIARHRSASQNKGTIYPPAFGKGFGGSVGGFYQFNIQAPTIEQAYKRLCEDFQPEDQRPLAGKSYLRRCSQ